MFGNTQDAADQPQNMQARPDIRRDEARAHLHCAPVARKRRPLGDLGTETDELHPSEEHRPDHIGQTTSAKP